MKQIQLAVSEIQRGQGRPVYLIHGDEPWLLWKARRGIVEALQAQGASVLRYTAEAEVETVVGELVSLSLFAEPRVIVWTDCPYLARGGGDVPKKRLLEALDSDLASSNTTLVLTAEKVDKASKLFRRIAALGVEMNYPALSPYNLGQSGKDEAQPYVEAYISSQGKSLRPDAFRELRLRVAVDLWTVMSELDRLMAYVGEQKSIELRDVQDLIAHSKTDVIFDLTDAIGARDVKTALDLIERLVESGTNPLMILATLSQNVAQVREARILVDSGVGWSQSLNYSAFQQKVLPAVRRIHADSSLLNMHPFAAFKGFQRAQAFQVSELDKILQGLAEIDVALKTSSEDGLRALQMFVLMRVARS